MMKIIETNQEMSAETKKESSSSCFLERTVKMDGALEKFEFCFDDSVINRVPSSEIINSLSTRPLFALMEPSVIVDGIDSKKIPHAFLLSVLLFGKQ